MFSKLITPTVTFFLSSKAILNVQGFSSYGSSLPNSEIFGQKLGHDTNKTNFELNAFGKAFPSDVNNLNWTALCKLDSDSDGLTNGQELGDACCTGTATTTDINRLSNPGDPSDTTKNPETCLVETETPATEAPPTEAPPTEAPATETPGPTPVAKNGTSTDTDTTTGVYTPVMTPETGHKKCHS